MWVVTGKYHGHTKSEVLVQRFLRHSEEHPCELVQPAQAANTMGLAYMSQKIMT